MLLNEIYHEQHGIDLADHAKDVLARLEKSGAREEHGPELNELAELIKEYEAESGREDQNREIHGGYDTGIGYAAKRLRQSIDHLGYQVSASTGAGGFHKGTRDDWNTKQQRDPLARKIRGMRDELNREPDEDEEQY